MFNIEKRRQAMLNCIDAIMSDPYMIAIKPEGDDKFYLTKNAYRLEIRDDNSSVWDSYVVLPNGNSDGDKYKEYLVNKYLDLVANSDPKHFHDEEEN